MGLAVFALTAMYAILRYNVNVNGSEPHSNIVMYIQGVCVDWSLDDGCLAFRWQSSCPRIDLPKMVED